MPNNLTNSGLCADRELDADCFGSTASRHNLALPMKQGAANLLSMRFHSGYERNCFHVLETILYGVCNGYIMVFYQSSKEVWKLNFRQYGEMEVAQPGRNSDVEKVSREKIRDGESQKRVHADAPTCK